MLIKENNVIYINYKREYSFPYSIHMVIIYSNISLGGQYPIKIKEIF